MLTRILHGLMANPRVYDLVQSLVGAAEVHRRLARQVELVRDARLVLDLGGGTGLVSELFAARGGGGKYVCLDIDPAKLEGFRAKYPAGLALQADAAHIPLADATLDAAVCTNVSHHLPGDVFPQMLAEVARVLRPGGTFVFLDAVWNPTRWAGRVIWRYDRGSFPRTAHAIRAAIAGVLNVEHWEQFAIHHEYALCVARRER